MICSRAWLTVMYLSRIHSIDDGFNASISQPRQRWGWEGRRMRTGIFHEKRLVAHAAIQHLAKHKPMLRWGPKTYLDILPAYKSRWIPRRLVDLAAARHVLLALLLDLYHHSIDLSVSTVMRVLLGHSLSIYESTDMLQDTPAFVPKCKGKGTSILR